jgi:hypothetical protein
MTHDQAVIEHARQVLDALKDVLQLCQKQPNAEDRPTLDRIHRCRASKQEQLQRARAAGLIIDV